MTCVNLVL